MTLEETKKVYNKTKCPVIGKITEYARTCIHWREILFKN